VKITIGYDRDSWAGYNYYAYDESTYDGPEYTGPFAHGASEDEALDELAAQWVSKKGYEDFTTESLDAEAVKAADRGDLTTTKFIGLLRAFV
jgi:hypothetical protein